MQAAWLVVSLLVALEPGIEVRQVTHGPKHHFFGYIGQSQTIPWNESGRYIVALQTDFHDHMPQAGEPADVILIDTRDGDAIRVVDQTRAWNFQQGTMLYWNPLHPETQFFFNDRDPKTNQIFCALFDISTGKRIAEYRYEDSPFGNSGVAPRGGWFAGLNYGRLARLRPVTGYPGAFDWTMSGTATAPSTAPINDGVFLVNAANREKRLLVSFERLAAVLAPRYPNAVRQELFINHTLWNRECDRIFFFVRGDFETKQRLDVPMIIRPDGSGLAMLADHLGGHPEWALGHTMIGSIGDRAVLYDVDRGVTIRTLGEGGVLGDPRGDKSLSPEGDWLVNGFRERGLNYYVLYRMSDGAHVRSRGFDQHGWTSGELRVDPAPCWNRDGTQILFPSITEDGNTRQLFAIELNKRS